VHHINRSAEVGEIDAIWIPVVEDSRECDIDVEFLGKNENPISSLVYYEVSRGLGRIAAE
jgi:hypothetical protein